MRSLPSDRTRSARARRLRAPAAGTLAVLCVAAAMAMPVQGVSDNQASHLALLRALSAGTTQIDEHARSTQDKVRLDGHFYSNKAPGLALASLPGYGAFVAAGGPRAADRAGRGPRASERATAWAVGLATTVLATLALLLLVARVGERIERGLGAAAAVTLGLGTLLLPFSTMLFAHALSALLGFAAFALLWRESGGPGRSFHVAVAGALGGLAIATEYTLAVVVAVLGVYALARRRTLRRAAAYGSGVVAGVLPLLAYNTLAFGSPLHVSYSGVAAQSAGLFGVRPPRAEVALDLLAGHKGLLVMSPVLAAAAVGLVLMARRGMRAEALTCAAAAAGLLIVNAGFYLEAGAPGASDHPFGGFTPGPRLLVPALPFLAVGLAPAYRRFPRVTLLLAGASAARMLLATLTEPLVSQDTGVWWERLGAADFTATVFTELGAGHGWLAVAPVLAAALAAAGLAGVAAREAAREAGATRRRAT